MLDVVAGQASILAQYKAVRDMSHQLTHHLSEADQTPQSMTDASPVKWHLAHTTWFFETFILVEHDSSYKLFDEVFPYLFNSYYEQAGPRYSRAHRGLITRPSASHVRDYRAHVDAAMDAFLQTDRGQQPDITELVELGCHHEQQHQELILTDVLHLFAQNPLYPVFKNNGWAEGSKPPALSFKKFKDGIVDIGHDGEGFSYDNESPRHQVLVHPFKLANRLITNGEYIEFIKDGGYTTPTLWLADGWAHLQQESWQSPLYWENRDGQSYSMTLYGLRPVDLHAPVTHVSYFEANAFANWAGKRLPTEFEWETAQAGRAIHGNFVESHALRPLAADATKADDDGMLQCFGDCWEWTGSSYLGYPGYRPPEGAIGEYNGKFMCGQFVLRGGSCVTSSDHIRASYRNFFYPHQRWQFAGIRLCEDA
jgi:ergothioneine biosynthesis protein EgtB